MTDRITQLEAENKRLKTNLRRVVQYAYANQNQHTDMVRAILEPEIEQDPILKRLINLLYPGSRSVFLDLKSEAAFQVYQELGPRQKKFRNEVWPWILIALGLATITRIIT